MSCLTIDAWHQVFQQHAAKPGDAGELAATLATITAIVSDCDTPLGKIERIEKMFDRMALRALERADGTG